MDGIDVLKVLRSHVNARLELHRNMLSILNMSGKNKNTADFQTISKLVEELSDIIAFMDNIVKEEF